MKIPFTIHFFLFLIFVGNAQPKDSIFKPNNQNKIAIKQFIIPAALITTGALMINSELNQDLQANAKNLFGEDFTTKADEYLLYIPIAQIYLGRYIGFEPKNNFKQQTINLIIANTISIATFSVLKHSVKEERPDQSNNYSFPSGHTATAFTNASLLFYEYKDSNLWYASSGFLFATATGILRIANNEHYTSDVLAGAGIGLASGLLVSYWNPFQTLALGKKKKTTAFVYPQIGNQIGLILQLQLD